MTALAIELTRRERDVLAQFASGRTKRQAADALGITRPSVSTYRKALRRKVGDAAMADLPALAARLGVEVAR
jgi:DNA-binding CsgD family transcriptional regulator